MISLQQIEEDLTAAMKAKDHLAVETLRGLKTRLQNGRIAKQSDLSEDDILALVKSEAKRRKEAAGVYTSGNRPELAKKELDEAVVLEKYLPTQMSEEQLSVIIDKTIAEMSATAADFGKVMGKLKAQVGNQADGSVLARLLKEKLNS